MLTFLTDGQERYFFELHRFSSDYGRHIFAGRPSTPMPRSSTALTRAAARAPGESHPNRSMAPTVLASVPLRSSRGDSPDRPRIGADRRENFASAGASLRLPHRAHPARCVILRCTTHLRRGHDNRRHVADFLRCDKDLHAGFIHNAAFAAMCTRPQPVRQCDYSGILSSKNSDLLTIVRRQLACCLLTSGRFRTAAPRTYAQSYPQPSANSDRVRTSAESRARSDSLRDNLLLCRRA